MKYEFDDSFCHDPSNEKSRVFQYFPNVFGDARGSFLEFWKDNINLNLCPGWFGSSQWIHQMNISYSKGLVVRGCHAQTGGACQAKLVTSLKGKIWDVITDARPRSTTFRKTKVYFLNPEVHNCLFVPRGFLHAFITGPDGDGSPDHIFGYICDNIYSKNSEICVSPTLAIDAFSEYCARYGLDDFTKSENLTISDKDRAGMEHNAFFDSLSSDWYADFDDCCSDNAVAYNPTTCENIS